MLLRMHELEEIEEWPWPNISSTPPNRPAIASDAGIHILN